MSQCRAEERSTDADEDRQPNGDLLLAWNDESSEGADHQPDQRIALMMPWIAMPSSREGAKKPTSNNSPATG